MNVPTSIGAVVSSKLATLAECDSVYGIEDLYLLLEVISVDAHNRRAAEKHADSRG